MGVQPFTKYTKSILFTVIHKVCQRHQRQIVNSTNSVVHVSADGRCDSPGYSAKYGTYSVMDNSTGKILDFSLVHVGAVENSSRMALKGMITCLTNLENDRHPQVKGYMRNQRK